ncbi:MAG: hypothetical protein K9L68_03560 [Spirochaetales bacterium]|nr:hypothetical protein [Spirochaetales bacterium]
MEMKLDQENTVHPNEPDNLYMLTWIMQRYRMSLASLARMFQTNKSTVHYWLKSGNMSFRNEKKLRSSFFYLNNTKDPHQNKRLCSSCRRWLDLDRFRYGKSMCRSCEYKRRKELEKQRETEPA